MKDVSVFSRVFSYRQRETHSPLENFLTEISELNFFKNFLAEINAKKEIQNKINISPLSLSLIHI